jgi:thiamine-phosphate pyrophosphorylase
LSTLPFPRLYAICDADVCAASGYSLIDYAADVCAGGATLLQIRAKHAPSGAFLDAARAIVERVAPSGCTVIINDRVDVAVLSGAGGVHVGQEDLEAAQARRLLPAGAVIGLSTHTPAQVDAALTAPIDYLAIGPVFATGTKDTGYTAIGLDAVRETAARVGGRLPIVAIGGITLARAPEVIAAGASSVAVISDLAGTGDVRARVAQFLRELSKV